MTKAAARKTDQHACPKKVPISHGEGEIQAGSDNVTICDSPAARIGDHIKCQDGSTHPITESQACVLINGKRAARLGDKTAHGGEITSGAGTVLIADNDPFVELGDSGQIHIGANVFFGAITAEIIEDTEVGALVGGPIGALIGGGIGAITGILSYYYKPAPKDRLPAFPDAEKAKRKTPDGAGGLRKRWKDPDGKIYEWDSQHGKVESYDKNGKHLGEFDPETGEQTKPAEKTRKVEK